MNSVTPFSAPARAHAPTWGDAATAAVLHTTHAHDADEHANHLTGWEQRYDQLSCGRFSGELLQRHLPHVQVFRERISRSVRQACTVWSDALWLGLPDLSTPAGPATRIDGRINGGHDIMVRPGDAPFELLTPDAHSIFGVVVRRQALQRAAERQGCQIDWTRLQDAYWLQAGTAARLHSQHLLEAALAPTPTVALSAPQQAAHAEALQAELIDMVVRMLDQGTAEDCARHSLAKRQRVVTLAREHVLAHPDRAITVPELCEQLHVSRRTLQYCFDDVLGVSPLQYLRAIRLNGARRQLRQAASHHQSVQDVAVRWGFWHFSQFASDYRKLFGETPSATLKAGAH